MKNTMIDDQEKLIIKSYLVPLIQKFVPDFEVPKRSKLITCPICNNKESANLFPLTSHKLNCFDPKCGSFVIYLCL